MKNRLLLGVKLIVLILSVAFIIIGQMKVGKLELGLMLIGLAGLLALLYDYNRKYI